MKEFFYVDKKGFFLFWYCIYILKENDIFFDMNDWVYIVLNIIFCILCFYV